MVPDVDDIPFLVHILLHGAAQTLSHQLLRVIPQDISADSSRQLQDKHNNHKDGECEDHAVILANGSAASEKGNDEDDDPDGDQKSGHGEEVLRKEMTVIMENSLNSRSHWYQDNSSDLKEYGSMSVRIIIRGRHLLILLTAPRFAKQVIHNESFKS